MTSTKTEPRSYKVEVIADRSGQWASNALRFSSYRDADEWAFDLACRWFAVETYRVVPSDDMPTR